MSMLVRVVSAVLLLSASTQASQVVLSAESKSQTGNVAYTLPTERTFLLNVPEAYRHGDPHPLVLSFHGGECILSPRPSLEILFLPSRMRPRHILTANLLFSRRLQ